MKASPDRGRLGGGRKKHASPVRGRFGGGKEARSQESGIRSQKGLKKNRPPLRGGGWVGAKKPSPHPSLSRQGGICDRGG